jgi:hypothetical protein
MTAHQCEAIATTTRSQCMHMVEEGHERCAAGHRNARRTGPYDPTTVCSGATAGAAFEFEDLFSATETDGADEPDWDLWTAPDATAPPTARRPSVRRRLADSAISGANLAAETAGEVAQVFVEEFRRFREWERATRPKPSPMVNEGRSAPSSTESGRSERTEQSWGRASQQRRRPRRLRRTSRVARVAWRTGTWTFREGYRVAQYFFGGGRAAWRKGWDDWTTA